MEFSHEPVLLNEVLDGLNIKKDGIYVDGTLGGAGHSSEVLKNLDQNGLLIGIDQDEEALSFANGRLLKINTKAKFELFHSNFEELEKILKKKHIEGVDGILLDIGVSSYQLDEKERGFSYQQDARLDMRMNKRQERTAEDIVNSYPEEKLKKIITEYGEERWSARIAKFIVDARKEKRIETTFDLVEIIKAAIPKGARKDGPHPAKRTFQALRIEVNDELGVLKRTIDCAASMLNSKGRLLIITFHSLEDRIVKQAFSRLADPCTCPKSFPVCVCGKKATVKKITRKPISASKEELERNHRSRSAKLRIIEKL